MGLIRDMAGSATGYVGRNALVQVSTDSTGQTGSGTYYVDTNHDVVASNADGLHILPIAAASDLTSFTLTLTGLKFNSPVRLVTPAMIDAGGFRNAASSLIGKQGQYRPATLTGSVTIG